MNVRLNLAKAAGAVSEWGLKHVFHRPAANFPGKLGLYADPQLIADLRPRIKKGCVVVCGTNGKTTVTNLIADTLQAGGFSVACNRTGANLDSGVASALLDVDEADWGVFESDELWLSRIAAQLEPDYLVLLNLFRDQLDRMGEIALAQESIVEALAASPDTVLVYNADDPLCQAIAERAGNPNVAFGTAGAIEQGHELVSDVSLCPRCDAELDYAWHQYGQLGSYRCTCCGFERTAPEYVAHDVSLGVRDIQLSLKGQGIDLHLIAPFTGAYMVYNLLAAYAACCLCKVPFAIFERSVSAFDPQNGRLQRYVIGGCDVLLNLAKNPTGFDQNISLIVRDDGPKAVAFFVNDREADGHDVSWLWDVDFQALAWARDIAVFAGGQRRNDVQVRLKYAGLQCQLVDDAEDFLTKAQTLDPGANCYIVANYTALPSVKKTLDRMAAAPESFSASSAPSEEAVLEQQRSSTAKASSNGENARPCANEVLRIVHLYPTLLNLYGDSGNVTVLENRMRWRGMGTQITRVDIGQDLDLEHADIVFVGGGPDREQHKAATELSAHAEELSRFVEDDGVLLAICGGYQILGRKWLLGNEAVPGLGILDITTKRAAGGAHNRLVGNIMLNSPLATMPVIGYENHAGRTFLDAGCAPFGTVSGRHGHGNNDADHADGVLYRNVIGTYLHGPLLAKNPEIADWLIERALERRAAKENRPAPTLPPLDDTVERAANEQVRKHLGLRP